MRDAVCVRVVSRCLQVLWDARTRHIHTHTHTHTTTMERVEQFKERVSSELKVNRQWEQCVGVTLKNAGIGALGGIFCALVLFPRTLRAVQVCCVLGVLCVLCVLCVLGVLRACCV